MQLIIMPNGESLPVWFGNFGYWFFRTFKYCTRTLDVQECLKAFKPHVRRMAAAAGELSIEFINSSTSMKLLSSVPLR